MRIRELMDVRLRPTMDPDLLPGVYWLLAHGFPMPVLRTTRSGEYCESKRAFTSQRRQCWVVVTGRKPRKNVRWSATVAVYGNPDERALAEGLDPYVSVSADMAVGVQIARLDELLYAYDKRKEKENGNKDS